MQSASRTSNGVVTHWKAPPSVKAVAASCSSHTHNDSNSPEAILSDLAFLQRMADAFEEQGNYAECVRSAESALLLRQANAETVAAALAVLQKQQQQQHSRLKVMAAASSSSSSPAQRTHAAAPKIAAPNSDSSNNHNSRVAITEKGDVALPLEVSQQAQDVVQRCNSYAVEALRHDQLDSAAFFLNRAMFLTDADDDDDNLDLRDLRSRLLSSEAAGTATSTSDRWWWRRVLQQQQQRQSGTSSSQRELRRVIDSNTEDVLDFFGNNTGSINAPRESAAVSSTAAALRACFRDTPHDQQLRLTLRAATLNHLGCLEQRRGRLGAAVLFFRLAICTATQLEETTSTTAIATEGGKNGKSTDDTYADADGKANLASTYLNLCTVLNALGRHAEAAQACERVVPLLQQVLQETVHTTPPGVAANTVKTQAQSADNKTATVGEEELNTLPAQNADEARVATMLVVAYYNLGVTLERCDVDRVLNKSSHNKCSDGAQRAFQQAVQVSHAYQLVPTSCRSIEAVMQALRRPPTEREQQNNKVVDQPIQKKRNNDDEQRQKQQKVEQHNAVYRNSTAAVPALLPPRPSPQKLSTHPPTHALPRTAALPVSQSSASPVQRFPRPPSAGLLPPVPPSHSPSAPPLHAHRAVSPAESSSNTVASFTNSNNSGGAAILSAAVAPYRRPSGDIRLNNSATSSTYFSSAMPLSHQQPSPTSSFAMNNAWSSPFAAAPPLPPAVLAPLPTGIGGASVSATVVARKPPPPVPPAAIFAHSTGINNSNGYRAGVPSGGTNFAATAPSSFPRPALPRLGLTSTTTGRDNVSAASTVNGGGPTAGATAIPASVTIAASASTTAPRLSFPTAAAVTSSQASSNPFGRRTFGSRPQLSAAGSGGVGRGPLSPAGHKLAQAPSARNGGERSGAKRARGFRERVAGGGTTAAASSANSTPTGEGGRPKQQQGQPQSERAKRQRSTDRRQQREAAASDALLAEKIYQQLVSEKEKTEVERFRRAAVQIQRVWRGVLARTWVSTLITAALCLQRAVRRFLVKARVEHARVAAEQARIRAEESARQEAACRVLQSRVRQFLRRLQIRREYRANQARLFYAARTIQRGYRAFCAQRAAQLAAQAEAHRREDEQRSFCERVAARRIQHAYLNYKTKRAELDAYQVSQRRIRSIVRIQAVMRGYLTRAWYAYCRAYRRDQEVRSAAMQAKLTVIQSACRAICSAYYGQQRALQALLHTRELQRHNAATKLQCMWRCHVAKIRRERLQAEHDRDVRHATRIQRWYRMRTQRRAFLAWRNTQQRMRAATRLQRWIRACWQATKAREFAAYHAELLRRQQLQRLQARSIVVMQACAHACVSSRLVASVRATFERNDALARLWQRVGRGYAARCEMALERRAAYKVALQEKEMQRRTAAARVLQRAWRGAAAKDKVESMRREVAAVNVIARAYRVYRARMQLADLRAAWQQQREHTAVCRIQQAVRGFLYGRRAKEMDAYYRAMHNKKMRRLRRVEAAVMIQSQWRGYVTRKLVMEERAAWQALSSAAAVIQRAWRARLARLQLRQTLAERIIERNLDSRAALKLQCFWRKMQAARRVAQLRQEMRQRKAAVSVLQSWWRMQLAQREFARMQRQRREEAALEVYYAMQWERHTTLINAFLRQRESQTTVLYQLKKQLISLLNEEDRRRFLSRHQAATKIQAVFRGHYERYYARGLRAQAREEQRRAAELLARQERAAITIQCAYRSAKAREVLAALRQAEFDRVQASHTDYLESADPSEVVRELFWLNSTYQQREATLRRKQEAAKRREAAECIQRLFRRHRAQRVVATVHNAHVRERAARLLQDCWRHHRDIRRIKEHQRQQAAATLLQSHVRGWLVRRCWPMYRASIEAEQLERVLVQDVLDHAAIVLQCFWRRVEAQRTAARMRQLRQHIHDVRAQQEAAMVIQEAFRNYQRRKRMGMI